MPNSAAAFGLRPVKNRDGSAWNGATIPMYVSASYATAMYIGEPVLLSPTLAEKDATGKKLTINASAGTDATIIFGVITSFEPLVTDLTKIYNPASTERIANVCLAKDAIFEVRGSGTALTSVCPGQNAVLTGSGGSTVTGLSSKYLAESGTVPAADQSYPLFILGLKDVEDNTLGANAVYEVLINTAENATGAILGVTAS
jgi:hypothetical protein